LIVYVDSSFLVAAYVRDAQSAEVLRRLSAKPRIWEYRDFASQTWETCIVLARRHGPMLGIRTLDSLHVACALELKAQKFWTFDDRQARLAEAVGLDTTA